MWLLFVSRNMNCFCWPARASAAHVPGVSGRSATLRSLFANNKVIDGVPTRIHQLKKLVVPQNEENELNSHK